MVGLGSSRARRRGLYMIIRLTSYIGEAAILASEGFGLVPEFLRDRSTARGSSSIVPLL